MTPEELHMLGAHAEMTDPVFRAKVQLAVDLTVVSDAEGFDGTDPYMVREIARRAARYALALSLPDVMERIQAEGYDEALIRQIPLLNQTLALAPANLAEWAAQEPLTPYEVAARASVQPLGWKDPHPRHPDNIKEA